MASKITDHLVDKRIVERNIKKGLLDKKEFERHLASLPDREDNAELVVFEDPASDRNADQG